MQGRIKIKLKIAVKMAKNGVSKDIASLNEIMLAGIAISNKHINFPLKNRSERIDAMLKLFINTLSEVVKTIGGAGLIIYLHPEINREIGVKFPL